MAISLSIKKLKNREYVYIVENYRDPATKRVLAVWTSCWLRTLMP